MKSVSDTHTRMKGVSDSSIKSKAFLKDRSKTINENKMAIYRDMFRNRDKKEEFDLLASKVSFDMRPDNSIITRDAFTRKVSCSHIEVASECRDKNGNIKPRWSGNIWL